MYNEAITGVRTLDVQDGYAVSIRVAVLKNQLNFSGMLFDLPNVLDKFVADNEKIQYKVTQMKASQEGGSI